MNWVENKLELESVGFSVQPSSKLPMFGLWIKHAIS